MYGFKIRIKGKYALFSRPEMKVERVSYDVPTPSALVGLISGIYWHPGVKYVIDKIYIYNPISFVNVRRNELAEKTGLQKIRNQMEGKEDASIYTCDINIRTQRASMLLRDVDYGVEFHFELTDDAEPSQNDDKCYNILLRRLKRGQYFNKPCLGCREFPADVSLVEELPESQLTGEVDLGYMLYDLQFEKDKKGGYSNCATPRFYRPHMINGMINVGEYAKELLC